MNDEPSLSEARLDRAIDRAVRELMQVDPSPGLRRRVLSRINAPLERPALPLMGLGVAAAALVLAVVSVALIPSRVEPPTPPQAPPLAIAAGIPAVAAPADAPLTSTATPPRPSSRPITREPIPIPRVTNVFGEQRSGVSAATVREPGVRMVLDALPPLTIVPLSARPVVIDPLVLSAPQKRER